VVSHVFNLFSQTFSKDLDPVANILLEPEDITKAASLLHYDPNDSRGNHFKCRLCLLPTSKFKGSKNRRGQLSHISAEHLKKVATVEQLAYCLKFLWNGPSKVDGRRRRMFYCHVDDKHVEGKPMEPCFATLARDDDRGKIIRSYITAHFKEKKKLKIKTLQSVWIRRKDELKDIKINVTD
jgi:hypothetical protein